MRYRNLFLFLGLTTLVLVCLILVKGKSRNQEGTKVFLKEGVKINDHFAQVTQQRWGNNPILLSEGGRLRQSLRNAIRFDQQFDLEIELRGGLEVAVSELIEAYSDGRYESVKSYYLKQTPLINSELLSKRATQSDEYLKTLKTSVALPLVSRPAKKGEDFHLEKFTDTSGSEQRLGVLYTNRIKIALVNEIVTRAYKNIDEKVLATSQGEEVLALVNKAVANKIEEIEHSDFYKYITPWEKLSSELLTIRVVKTNLLSNAWSANRELLQGTHRDLDRLFGYQFGPNEMVEAQGSIYFAVLQMAVKPKEMEYFGPVTACFFYNQKEKQWHLYQLACHAQIAPSIPF